MLQSPITVPADTPLPIPQAAVEKSVSVFGRLQSDFTILNDGGNFDEGVEFRRVRVGAKGKLSAATSYKVEIDFASNSSPSKFADAYLQINECGLGTMKVGHFKEPFGLNELTSSRFITFMERSLPAGFAPSRNHGLMFSDSTDLVTWQAGAFWDADGYGEDTDLAGANNNSFGARFVFRPWIEDKGKNLMHVAMSYNSRSGTKNFRSYPGSHESDSWAQTLTDADTFGLELAWTDGPLNVIAEMADTEAIEGAGNASSLQASWFIGDQYRGYKTSSGAFERAKGIENGAWELAARVGDYDFSEIGGDAGSATTLGLNWYVDKYTRVMIDSTTVAEDGMESYQVLAARFAFDF